MADNLKELIQKYNSINDIIRDLIDGYADNQFKKKTAGKEITGQDFSWAAFSKNNNDLNLNKEEVLRNIIDFLSKEKDSKKIYHYGIRQEDFPNDFDSLFKFIGKNIDIKPEAFEILKEDMRLYLKNIKSLDSFWNESVQTLIQNYIENFDTKQIKEKEYPDAEIKDNKVIDSHGTEKIKNGVYFRKLDVMNADAGENFLKENRWVRPWFNTNLTTYEFVRNNDIMMDAITSDKELQFTRKQLKKVNSLRNNSDSSEPTPPSKAHIYGVDWKIGYGSSLLRTDDSELFADPVPYVAGALTYNSPFDTLMPWSGMVKETIDDNSLVRIPKFWYKITKEDGHLKFQIADRAIAGFYVSPAHRARGSEPEHDYVWIGRYHCDFNYKSTSGSLPITYITRATARTGCHNLGSEYWMLDFSMWVTVWLLYIVEFANWDSQTKIGYNCGDNSEVKATGTTDLMPYHTGTIKSSRSTYGVGVQYRWIEDPWGNVHDWCDGITFNLANIYCFEDPANYSDSYQSTGATLVGTRPTSEGFTSDFGISSEIGFEWFLYPSRGGSQFNVTDYYYYSRLGRVLRVGGGCEPGLELGLFFLNGGNPSSYYNYTTGTRLQYRKIT